MIAPRFTLRTGLVVLTLGSLAGIAVREAALGAPWAVGVCVAGASIVLMLALHAVTFAISLALSRHGGESK